MQIIEMPVALGFVQNLNPMELALVGFVILLLFGAKRLPELGRGMGQFIREFKKTTSGFQETIRSSMEESPAPVQEQGSSAVATHPVEDHEVRD